MKNQRLAIPGKGTLRHRILDAMRQSASGTVTIPEIASRIREPSFVVSTAVSKWMIEVGVRRPFERVARGKYRLRKS